jgi:hypothetical protein
MNFDEAKKAIEAKRNIRNSKKDLFDDIPVLIKQISAYGMEEYRDYANSEDKEIRRLHRAKLVQLCMYHEESDKRFYTDMEVRDVASHNPGEIDRLYHVCLKINGYGNDGKEDILKNLVMILGEDGLLELRGIIDARLQSLLKDTPPGSLPNSGS